MFVDADKSCNHLVFFITKGGAAVVQDCHDVAVAMHSRAQNHSGPTESFCERREAASARGLTNNKGR